MIEVTRKDGTKRMLEIMLDRNTGKYCFVNLTSNHVCKSRFDTKNEALQDLYNDSFFVSWREVKQKKQFHISWKAIWQVLGIIRP
jgi:hypothetical protein